MAKDGNAGADVNSKRTRVQPVFGWLQSQADRGWAMTLLRMAHGFGVDLDCGPVTAVELDPEREVPASNRRLAWMLRHAELLVPADGARVVEFQRNVLRHPERIALIEALENGQDDRLPRGLRLEGNTHADCLIECERGVVWVEGKRTDWLSPATTWDSGRDQLARNLEAAWLEAQRRNKAKFWVVICHEGDLKHHEQQLIKGYRDGSWSAGLPHLKETERALFCSRIGTLTWRSIAERWPALQQAPALADLVGPIAGDRQNSLGPEQRGMV